MAATIFVWAPHGRQVGHASMSLSDGTYISWWPSGDEFDSPAMSYSMRADKRGEGERNPSYASAPIDGLDEAKISSWWRETSGRNPADRSPSRHETKTAIGRFKLFEGANCSNMVARALFAGGLRERYPLAAQVISKNALLTPLLVMDVAEIMTGSAGNKLLAFLKAGHPVLSAAATLYQYAGPRN